MTSPSTAITVSCPDDRIRLRILAPPMVIGSNRWGKAGSRRSTVSASAQDGACACRHAVPSRGPPLLSSRDGRQRALRPLAGTHRVPRRVGPPEVPGDGPRRGSHRRPAAAPRASRRPDPRPRRRRIPRPRAPGAAGSTGHRAPARRARRRGDLPRPGTARRLPDHQARGPRAAAPAARARARGRPRGHVRRLRGDGGPPGRPPRLLDRPRGTPPAQDRRAGHPDRARARATTASRSTWTWTSRTSA